MKSSDNTVKIQESRNFSLDTLRGVAILLVLGHHFPYYSLWSHVGWIGVNLFFVLSGFLVSGLLFDECRSSGTVRIRRFIIRRGFKIWPSFYLYLLAVAGLALVAHGPPERIRILRTALFVQNYFGSDFPTITGHLWSLCVEEHFYLLLPFLFWISLLFSGGFRIVAWVSALSLPICLLLRIAAARDSGILVQSHLLLDGLFCGVLLAYIRRVHSAVFQWVSGYWSLAPAALLILPAFVLKHESLPMQTLGLTGLSLGFALLLAWAVDRSPSNKKAIWALNLVAKIGLYSYPIYLWHLLIELMVGQSFGIKFSSFWASVLMAVILGVVMAQNTEQPFLRLRDRLFPA